MIANGFASSNAETVHQSRCPKLCPSSRETSAQAHQKIQRHAERIEDRILRFLQECGTDGATDDEIQVALGIYGDTQRPSRVRLCRAGLICGTTRKRSTRKGRAAAVWVHRDFASFRPEEN